MADLSCTLGGVPLRAPFVLASGPISYNADGLYAAWEAGAGAVVTKTIKREKTVNPAPHMAPSGSNGLINCEGWSDLCAEDWIEREIPRAKELGVGVLIANISGSWEDIAWLLPRVTAAGADLVEIGTGYFTPGQLVEIVRRAVEISPVPVIVKINSNWPNMQEVAEACGAAGVSAITAIESAGPVLRLDLAIGRPLLGSGDGFGWVSGAALLPTALKRVSDIARKTKTDIIATGGVMSGADALEMLLAGGAVCGVCTAAILNGPGVFTKLNRELEELLDRYGYGSVKKASRAALPHLEEGAGRGFDGFAFDADKCVGCGVCERVCCYQARRLSGDKQMELDPERCRKCGLCALKCPTGALSLISTEVKHG